MIADARERIRKLEISIKVFTQKKDRGEPWPGQLSGHSERQQHSV
jgi:hypothetical protein